MRKRRRVLCVVGCLMVLGLAGIGSSSVYAAEGAKLAIEGTVFDLSASSSSIFTISPDDNTYHDNMMNYSTYNSYTKHYYLIRSYLEALEERGGGTLVLKAGAYTISNTLFVPSNVTIRFSDGVVIRKGHETGTNRFNAATSIFQLIRPSRGHSVGMYGGYDGENNISFIGEGDVTIDLDFFQDGIAIIAGHNQAISIENIKFENMYSGHFIEIDATKDAVIKNNSFSNSKKSANAKKEAINIDTPDTFTEGWSQKWSTFDKTPNINLTIENNSFYNLDRAIGTHKYSGGKFHKNIVVRNNNIEKTRSDAIRVMNWLNSKIENNKIKDVAKSKKNYRGILASGAVNPTFRKNTFEKVARPMQFMPWKNIGPGSEYPVTYNKLSKANKKNLADNKAINTIENFIRINRKYNVFDKYTEKIYLKP